MKYLHDASFRLVRIASSTRCFSTVVTMENLRPDLRPGMIATLAPGTGQSGLSHSARGKNCGHRRATRSYRQVVMVFPHSPSAICTPSGACG